MEKNKEARNSLLVKDIHDKEYRNIPLYLSAGADPNKLSTYYLAKYNALLKAIKENEYYTAFELLRYGANLNFKTVINETALELAISNNNLNLVKLLLANGANPNTEISNNQTPLGLAITNNNLEIVNTLLEYNASATLLTTQKGDYNNYLHTPLTLATATISSTIQSNIRAAIIKSLIKHGASPLTENKQNKTPLMLLSTQAYPSKDILDALLKDKEFKIDFSIILNSNSDKIFENNIYETTHTASTAGLVTYLVESFCIDPFLKNKNGKCLAALYYLKRTPDEHILSLRSIGWSLEALAAIHHDASPDLLEALVIRAAEENRTDILYAIFTQCKDETKLNFLTKNAVIDLIMACIKKDASSPENQILAVVNKLEQKNKMNSAKVFIHTHLPKHKINVYEKLLFLMNARDNPFIELRNKSTVSTLETLVKENPNINLNVKAPNGVTLLDYAYTRRFSYDSVEDKELSEFKEIDESLFLILLQNSNIELRSRNNTSMLHIAVINKASPADILLFMLKGISVNARDSTGKKPIDYELKEMSKLKESIDKYENKLKNEEKIDRIETIEYENLLIQYKQTHQLILGVQALIEYQDRFLKLFYVDDSVYIE